MLDRVFSEYRVSAFGRPFFAPTSSQSRGCRQFFTDETAQVFRCLALKFGVQPNGVMVDVGANLGKYTILLSHCFPDARIVAIEPANVNLRFLRRNCQGLERIDIVERGVDEELGSGQLSMPSLSTLPIGKRNNTGMLSLHGSNPAGESIELATLDSLCNGLDVTFLKMDIEGNELSALRGARDVLESNKPLMQLELNPRYLNSEQFREMKDVFVNFGYRGYSCNGKEQSFDDIAVNLNRGRARDYLFVSA